MRAPRDLVKGAPRGLHALLAYYRARVRAAGPITRDMVSQAARIALKGRLRRVTARAERLRSSRAFATLRAMLQQLAELMFPRSDLRRRLEERRAALWLQRRLTERRQALQ